jgi:CheY-like chemotaxis protein
MKKRSSLPKLRRLNMSTASSPLLSPPLQESEKRGSSTFQTLEYARSLSKTPDRAIAQRQPLLLLSEDEVFCWKLLITTSQIGRRLVRGHPAADGPQMLRIVRPEVVLLDLDLAEEIAWITADALLQAENCPPLILLTSRGKQSDFDTAIQAGCLIEKTIEPMRLVAVVEHQRQWQRPDNTSDSDRVYACDGERDRDRGNF